MIAVLDIGKTNVKLSVATADGAIIETLSTPNAVYPAPPYRHHDVVALEDWLAGALAALGRRHVIDAIMPCGHGSGAVLVNATGPAMPMIDYEDEPPAALNALYRHIVGCYRERGSAVMMGASHIARQLLWLQTGWPDAVANATAFLALPQYWAWRLSGVAAAEPSCLGAQSHLWSAISGVYAPIVAARGWERLLPAIRPGWTALGPLSPEWAVRTGLPADVPVLCGVHDSTANFYRYQAAGMRGLTVISTGTWIVGISDETRLEALDEARGMTSNADPAGRPLAGALCMGGREYALIAGQQSAPGHADPAIAAALIARGTIPVPCFGEEDGMLPGRGGRGYFDGPPPESAAERRALAVIATALLTCHVLDSLASQGSVVLDGTFATDPLYPALVASLRPDQRILFNLDTYGVAAGAALLAGHASRTNPAPVALLTAQPLTLPALPAYRARWRRLAAEPTETPT